MTCPATHRLTGAHCELSVGHEPNHVGTVKGLRVQWPRDPLEHPALDPSLAVALETLDAYEAEADVQLRAELERAYANVAIELPGVPLFPPALRHLVDEDEHGQWRPVVPTPPARRGLLRRLAAWVRG